MSININVGQILQATVKCPSCNTMQILVLKTYGKNKTTGFYGKVLNSTIPYSDHARNWNRFGIYDGSGIYLPLATAENVVVLSEPEEFLYKLDTILKYDKISKETKETITDPVNDTFSIYYNEINKLTLCMLPNETAGYSMNPNRKLAVLESYLAAKKF